MSRGKKVILDVASKAARLLPPGLKKAIYRIPFLSRFIRQRLNKAVPVGIQEIAVAAGALKGMRLSLDLHAEKDYWLGTYETDLQIAMRDYIQPGMTVYDVGANIGYISLIAARLVGNGGKVYSFETLPDNIKRLQENIRQNDMDDRVQVCHSAVVDHSGETTFFTHKSGAMGKAAGSAGRQEEYTQSIHVRAVALDDFVFTEGNPPPQIIKMDIEGGEILAVQGMKRLLAEVKPLLLIELHGEEAARSVWQALTENGFTLHTMRRGYAVIRSLTDLDWKAYILAQPEKKGR